MVPARRGGGGVQGVQDWWHDWCEAPGTTILRIAMRIWYVEDKEVAEGLCIETQFAPSGYAGARILPEPDVRRRWQAMGLSTGVRVPLPDYAPSYVDRGSSRDPWGFGCRVALLLP